MPETYTPLIWRNDQTPPINEGNLNHLEQGVEGLDDRAAALELGITNPILLGYATSLTLNATQGCLFRCVATGDLTIDDIVGGVDGQTIVVEIQASGADRTLHFTGSTGSIPITVGQWWVGIFRYIAASSLWLLDDSSGGGGSGGSGNDLNILAPQNIPYAATITPNAAVGALFRVTAVGDFTLNDPVNGTNGQAVVVEVLASGGQRTVTLAGGQTTPVAVASGTRWTATLRYDSGTASWILAERSDASSSSSGVSSVNGQAGAVVLDADDIADGSTHVTMTTAERTKLTGVATGATANSTDATLLNRSNHTGTQAVGTITGLAAVATSGSASDLSTGTVGTARLGSGTANSTKVLCGDQTWTVPGTIPVTTNTQTGTSYTLVLADAGAVVEMNNASAMTVTVPPNSSVAFAVGTTVELCRYGAGTLTVAAGAGVTIRNPGSALTARAQYSTLSLRKRATDEWVLSGDLT